MTSSSDNLWGAIVIEAEVSGVENSDATPCRVRRRARARRQLAVSLLCLAALSLVCAAPGFATGIAVQDWGTSGTPPTPTGPSLTPGPSKTFSTGVVNPALPAISVNDNIGFQKMSGFGGTLTDSSAFVLTMDMGSAARTALLKQLFSPTSGIGLSYLRIPIGGNDYSQGTYSLACAGQTTAQTDKCEASNNYTEGSQPGSFLSSQDTTYLIPVLQQILAINPNVQIIATPWTAPTWMKTGTAPPECSGQTTSWNGGYDGGWLAQAHEGEYAQYLAKFVSAYAHLSPAIPISALTVDNEPSDPNTSLPSMAMCAAQQIAVAADAGSVLRHRGLTMQVIGLEDNWPDWPYAQQLLNSSTPFGGISFHCYKDTPDAAESFYLQFPTEPIYETECSPQGKELGYFGEDLRYNTQHDVIEAIRDGSKNAMFWNLALDQNDGPSINDNPVHGCESNDANPCLPLVQVNNGNAPHFGTAAFGRVTYQVGYYVLAQVSKFVQPGATRIASSNSGNLHSVAFKNTNGQIVLLVLNTTKTTKESSEAQSFNVEWDGQSFEFKLPADSVETFVWSSVPPGSCSPSSSLMVLTKGMNVISYVPKGNWSSQAFDTGVSVVNVEGSSIAPTKVPTLSAVNSCAANPLTGLAVCTANDNEVYVLKGTTLAATLHSGGTSVIGFSGGDCTNCGVAIDAIHNSAVIGLSNAGSPAFEFLDLGTDIFGSPFDSPSGAISEDPLIDPIRGFLLSPAENGDFEIADVSNPDSPVFYENATGGGELDSGAEDCSTGIALAPAEGADPSSVFVTDLTEARFSSASSGATAGTWTAPSQNQTLAESSLSAGATGIAVAQGTHIGVVTGEFGGNALTALALPTSSGKGTPAMREWVTCSIPNTPDGNIWVEGDDPHTVAAYQSPNSGDAIGLFGNEGATWLARVDLTKLLNPAVVPRDTAGEACAAGTLPPSVVSFIPVP